MPNFFAVLEPDNLSEVDDESGSDDGSTSVPIAEEQDADSDPAAERRALLVGPDLLPTLIKHFDQSTLGTAMRVHTSFNKLAGPRLYRTVVFDYSKPFNQSIGARILHRNYEPTPNKGGSGAFEYIKAHYFANHTTELEIINHPGEVPDGWHCRVARLRELCPNLDVIRFKVHPADFRYVYQATMHDASHTGFKPRVVDIIPLPAGHTPIAKAPGIITAIHRAHVETHLQIDATQPLELADQIYQAYTSVFGMPELWDRHFYDANAMLYIDFVHGFGSTAITVAHINKLGPFFFRIRTSIQVVTYVTKVTEDDLFRVQVADECFKERIPKYGYFCEEAHGERLEACGWEVELASEIGKYNSINSSEEDESSDPEDDDEDDSDWQDEDDWATQQAFQFFHIHI